jgi:hypothetical protein
MKLEGALHAQGIVLTSFIEPLVQKKVKPALLNSDEGVGERQHALSFLLGV